MSEVVLILRDDGLVVSGTVRYQGRIYEINPVGGTDISIVDVNPGLYVRDRRVYPQRGQPRVQTDVLSLIPGGKKMIDVMVVYTPAAKAGVEARCNNTCTIQDKITQAVAQANTSLGEGSQLEFRLVYVNEVNYSQFSVNTDLSYLHGKTDNYLDQVHEWRCSFKADVVSLWVDYDPPEQCGEAYSAMGFVSTGMWGSNYSNPAEWAFSVVRQNCANNFLTFHHELGHIMGADHDRSDVIARMGGSLPGYGFGFIYTPLATIMAIPQYPGWLRNVWSSPSNPDGLGTSTEDNRRVLNETAGQVSIFSEQACPGGSDPSPATPERLRIQ